MPYEYKRPQKCKQKSGKHGTYVSKKAGATHQKCWKSEEAFTNASAAKHAKGLKEMDTIPEKIYKKPVDDSDLGFEESRFEFPAFEPLPIDRDIQLHIKEQLLKKYIRKLILELAYRKNTS